MFRTAMIGCGGIAHAHAKILQGLDRIQWGAFCDVVEERAAQFNETYAHGKGKVYADFARMYDKEKLDLVYICLPPFAHSNEVDMAAERGIHVFIEKPIALDMETAHRMVTAVEEYRIKAQVGFMFRFGDAIEGVKGMLDSGEAGPPGLMMGRYFCNSLHSPWWRDRSKSGGQVVEQIVHIFDLARHLMGEVSSAFCCLNNLFHRDVSDYTVEDVSATVLRFENGAVGTISATNGAIPGKWIGDYKVVARNITVYFEDANNAVIYHTDALGGRTTTIASQKDTKSAETLDLLDAIENDRPPKVPMIEGAKTLQLVLAVSQSADQGKPIML